MSHASQASVPQRVPENVTVAVPADTSSLALRLQELERERDELRAQLNAALESCLLWQKTVIALTGGELLLTKEELFAELGQRPTLPELIAELERGQ